MRTLPAALAAPVALALACGDTLVDHRGTAFFDTGPPCQAGYHQCPEGCVLENASSCGDSCTTCTAAPAGAVPICAAHACDFECTGGLLRCGAACCQAAAVAAGTSHTCAVASDGTVKCWGRNDQGQAGTGAAGADVDSPSDVAGLAGATAVAAGVAHTCAVESPSGTVFCWGRNDRGQAGTDSAGADVVTPVAVAGLSGAAAVAAGLSHTCALDNVGGVWCWGDNSVGQLGTGETPLESATPLLVPGLAAVAIASGPNHTCTVTAAAEVNCWGLNDIGQLGPGYASVDPVFEASPVTVVENAPAPPYAPLASALTVAAGGAHACAAVQGATDLELWCWGSNLSFQLGIRNGTRYSSAWLAADVSTRPSRVAAGTAHTCSLRPAGGGLKCFGDNTSGQLGAALAPDNEVDVTFVGSTSPPAAVAAGGDHTCAILEDGTLWCWGSNAHGELGDATTASHSDPRPVAGRPASP
jgi:alpha-tubulin suppressor-like RCC1 family protein